MDPVAGDQEVVDLDGEGAAQAEHVFGFAAGERRALPFHFPQQRCLVSQVLVGQEPLCYAQLPFLQAQPGPFQEDQQQIEGVLSPQHPELLEVSLTAKNFNDALVAKITAVHHKAHSNGSNLRCMRLRVASCRQGGDLGGEQLCAVEGCDVQGEATSVAPGCQVGRRRGPLPVGPQGSQLPGAAADSQAAEVFGPDGTLWRGN